MFRSKNHNQVILLALACAVIFLNGPLFVAFDGSFNSPPTTEFECFTSSQVDQMIQEALRKESDKLREQITQELRRQITQELREQIARDMINGTKTLENHRSDRQKDTTADGSETQSAFIQEQVSPKQISEPRFSNGMNNLVVGMAKVDRDEFTTRFDLGVPLDRSDQKNHEVLFLYSHADAMPSDPVSKQQAKSQTTIPRVSAEDATANCDFLNIVFQHHGGRRRQCMAIMRLPEDTDKLNSSTPLILASRGADGNHKFVTTTGPEKTKEYMTHLQRYLGDLGRTAAFLRPILKRVAVQNTVVVMTCNFGQSEHMLNFLCSAKRRGLDTSSIVVFAMDQGTDSLLKNVGGVTVVYLEQTFSGLPLHAAGAYGDNDYAKLMLAKVYCVHLPVFLGYNVLFQDVDIVWYRHPLDFFHNTSRKDSSFDLYFQDDGNRLVYPTYSANSGFYYVRNNPRTVHFFNALLMEGDDILERRSHQSAIHSLLQEHASLYALKIKVYAREETLFPGGYSYRVDRSYMKKFVKGEIQPILFHMSWTASKTDKLKFFQQMGDWYLADSCTSISSHYNESNLRANIHAYSSCCLKEPTIVCHNPSTPSIIPCPNSTFWKDMEK